MDINLSKLSHPGLAPCCKPFSNRLITSLEKSLTLKISPIGYG
jgi:hypothetical protein